jgi:Family of unknown function (DUF5681)
MTDEETPSDPKYKVGYGKPPKERQFVKGKSGNLRGRPPGKFKLTLLQAADEPTIEIILHEAYRAVKVVEGAKVTRIPTIQAATRSLGIAAMKGDRLAHRNLIEIVQKSEAKKREDRIVYYQNCTKHKKYWERQFAICDARGVSRPEVFPHPDDIFLNPRTGEVAIDGPMDAAEKADLDFKLAFMNILQTELDVIAAHMMKWPGDLPKEIGLKEQRFFDEVNALVPERYRRVLRNRLPDDGSQLGSDDE